MIIKIIKRVLPESLLILLAKIHLTIRNWRVLYNHVFKGAKFDIKTRYHVQPIKEKKRHCFFGYYDVSPFSSDSTKVLNITTDGKSHEARINIYDIKSQQNEYLIDTHVWNWQQGCRLRWFPGKNNWIAYNDMENNRYCCRIVDVSSKKVLKTLSEPLYDIDPSGQFGLTLNFARLGLKRPAYGYTFIPYCEEENPINEGIDLIRIENNSKERLFTYKELEVYLSNKKDNYQDYYINHISYSPSGNRFLFFFLDASTKRHEAYMFVYDIVNRELIPLEVKDKVSHYVWVNENEIIATVYDAKMNCGYYIYDIPERKKTIFNNVKYDGHPSMFSLNEIISDTYADSRFFQHLYVADKKGKKSEIARIFDYPYMLGEKRTDLHPRLNKNKSLVCVDANILGYRQMCLFSLS